MQNHAVSFSPSFLQVGRTREGCGGAGRPQSSNWYASAPAWATLAGPRILYCVHTVSLQPSGIPLPTSSPATAACTTDRWGGQPVDPVGLGRGRGRPGPTDDRWTPKEREAWVEPGEPAAQAVKRSPPERWGENAGGAESGWLGSPQPCDSLPAGKAYQRLCFNECREAWQSYPVSSDRPACELLSAAPASCLRVG